MTAIFCKTIQVFMPFSRLHNSIYTVPYVNSGTDKRNCSVFQWWLYHFLSGILAVFLCLFRKKYVISANTVIVNRQFSLHQLPPLHKFFIPRTISIRWRIFWWCANSFLEKISYLCHYVTSPITSPQIIHILHKGFTV